MTNEKSTTKRNATSELTISQRRKQRSRNRGTSESADWESVNPQKLLTLIGLVTSHKGTITFGYTRDGGAYYLNYYFESESEKVYIRPTEDIDGRLDDEIDSWTF